MPNGPGRPRRASRELLQEAAFELFQLRGYRRTSIEQIARTAGFSRATFFNFFPSKAELFWVETDALLAALGAHLERRLGEDRPPPIEAALLEFAEGLSSADIPWSLQNVQLIQAAEDLIASGASRVLEVNRLLLHYLNGRAVALAGTEGRQGSAPSNAARRPASAATASTGAAAALTALLLTALLGWVGAGRERGGLHAHLECALETLAPAT